MRRIHLLLGALALAAYGCAQNSGVQGVSQGLVPATAQRAPAPLDLGFHKIRHIIVIVQENRTVDNLFNYFPGANTVRSGRNLAGQYVELRPIPLTAPYDLSHIHGAWMSDYDNGSLDGFSTENEFCRKHKKAECPPSDVAAYGYVPENETKPYWRMASEYTFGDDMFATNEGPSFPAHQYIVSGTSTIADGSSLRASENPKNPYQHKHQGGCSSYPHTTVETIDEAGTEGIRVYPCFVRTSIMDLLNRQHVSWNYYQAHHGAGLWNAVDAIKQIWDSPSYANVKWPSKRVLSDIAAGKLAQVVFVTPTAAESDHADHNNGSGPDWVGSIVNAVGKSRDWDTSAIFVTWDDWGGWFDHVKPVRYNSYELGFRVPLIVISPYAKAHFISHRQHEFGSILKFIEKVYDLPSLGTTDVRADDLSDCFDFYAKPRAFKPIRTTRDAAYFLRQPDDNQDPDDDR
jgi:phospholipase C